MEKRYDVLVFGDTCVDLVLSGGDVVPEFGQREKLVGDYSLEMGGSCTIFASQAGKLGLKTAVVGRVGNDSLGELVCRTLAASGVSVDFIKRDDKLKTGITVHMDTGADRAMLTYTGTIDSVEASDIDEELLRSVRHLHIGSYFLMKKLQPLYPGIIRKLKLYGATISLDTNWDPEETWENGIKDILPYVDMIFPNEKEVINITRASTAAEGIERLLSKVPIVAVKKGIEGSLTYSKYGIVYAPALEVRAADAVGAGDSFDAGFMYGYLTGRSMEECARIGCICGSLSTRAHGGIRGQPGLDELERFISQGRNQ